MSVIDEIEKTARACPAATAFLSGDGGLNYGEFLALLHAVTGTLRGHGVRAGDVVGLSMGQSPLHCVVLLALARLGAVSVPVHPEFPLPTRERIVAKFGVGALISLDGQHGISGLKDIRLGVASRVTVPMEAGFTDKTPAAAMPFRISLTSGTTGIPKGDLLTHGHLTDRVERTLFGCNCDRTSRVMPSDINFTMAIAVCFGVLSLGGTIVFPTSSRPEDRIQALKEHAVTHAFLSQWAITQMLDVLPDPRIAFPALQHLRPVGSLASEALLDSLRTRFTSRIFVTYGLTELGPVSMADPETLRRWPRSGGHLLPWVKVEVLDPEGTVLPRGKSGEIRVHIERGATEYHGDAEASSRKFRDGWFYTGDHGRISEEGLIFIEGRIDEMINLAGYKISPCYVEDVLTRHPQVAEAVAFVMQEGDSGEFLASAVIARTGGIGVAELSAHADRELGWGSPKRFFVMPDFPRTPNGKPIRAEMARLALRMPA